MNKPLRIVGCLLAAVVLLPVLALVLFEAFHKEEWERPPFPLERLDLLGANMRTQDVGQLLGPPSMALLRTNGTGCVHAEWVYSGGARAPIVYVSFKPDGSYEKHAVDY